MSITTTDDAARFLRDLEQINAAALVNHYAPRSIKRRA